MTPSFTRRLAQRALLAFVFSIPWDGVVTLGGFGTFSKLIGLAAIGLFAWSALVDGQRHALLDVHWLTLAFASWVLLSNLWTVDNDATWDKSVSIVQLVAVPILCWELLDDRLRYRQLATAFVAGSGVLMVSILLQTAANGASTRYRLSGANPNDIAFTMSLTIALAWWASLRSERPLERMLLQLSVPVALFTCLLTASRSALLTSAIALVLIPLTADGFRASQRLALLCVAGAVVAFGPQLIPSGPLERLSTTSTELSSGDLNGRTELWREAADMIDAAPVEGIGAGAARGVIAGSLIGRESGLHNTYLEVAAELGLVGLGLFLLVLVSAVFAGLSSMTIERRFLLVFSAVLAAGLFPRHWEYNKTAWLCLAVMIGVGRFALQERSAELVSRT